MQATAHGIGLLLLRSNGASGDNAGLASGGSAKKGVAARDDKRAERLTSRTPQRSEHG